MNRLRTAGLLGALALAVAASADEGVKVVRATIASSNLSWYKSLEVPQFNEANATLTSVDVKFNGAVTGMIQLENRDSLKADYSAQVSYSLNLFDPSNRSLLLVQPQGDAIEGTLPKFDQVADYAGTSGLTYNSPGASTSGTVTLSGDALAPFIGNGTVLMPVDAKSQSYVTTPGNFDSKITTYASADIELTYHYSYTPTTQLGSLGDRVWFDANGNGKQDEDERGIAGVTVKLLDASNTVLKTTTTEADGTYLFDDLAAGTYQVSFGRPNGYRFTTANQGGAALDSDADANGLSPLVTLGQGQDRDDVDAGLVGTLCLGDRVWKDLDKDGLQQSCEPGFPNVGVHLIDAAGNVVADTKTDANGKYLFSNLAPGDYTVKFDAPNGYGFTKQFANANYKQYDSNVDPTSGEADVTLVSSDVTIDAGLVGALKIGDTVWLDSDGDGRQDDTEAGIPNVKVFLIGDTNGDGWPDVARSTKTDANGRYLFLGLLPGTYAVTVNAYDLPSGVTQTYDLDGLNSRNVAIARVTGDRLDFDFGYKPAQACKPCEPKWWGSCNINWCNLPIGGKCHTKTIVCHWLKKNPCGDASITLYQCLAAAKLNIARGCYANASVKDAICKADAWLRCNPVGCNVSTGSSKWSSISSICNLLDRYNCNR